MTDVVLIQTLQLAVPLWISRLSTCTDHQIQARAVRCGQILAAKGDALQFKGNSAKGRRSTVVAFNGLAEGLACAAYAPGGVVFAGLHWCVGSRHMGVSQDRPGPCDAEVARDTGPAPVRRPVRRNIVDVHLS